MEKTEKREKDSGVVAFPSAFSLISCPPIPGKLDLKWENISLTLLFNGAMTQYREGWKLHHVSVRSLCLSEWRLLIYYSDTSYSLLLSAWSFLLEFFHLSFHLSPCFCSSLLVSSPVLSSLPSLSFCVHMKGRQGLWQPLKRDQVCVCVGACQAKEQRVICSITSTALNCIKQLTDLFYDWNMRYLTYHCHKAQQTQGRGPRAHGTRTHTYVTKESWWWGWRQMYV